MEFLNKVKEKCQNTKILGLIGSIIIIIATFFTYAKISFFGIKEKVSLISTFGGVIILILGILNLALIFKNYIKSKLPQNILDKIKIIDNNKIFLVPTALIIIILLSTDRKIFSYGLVKPAIGCFIIWIGIILCAIYPFIYKKDDSIIEVKKVK